MSPLELLWELAENWDWLRRHADAPPALEVLLANFILNTIQYLLSQEERKQYPQLSARLPQLYRCIERGDIETFEAWWSEARPLLLQPLHTLENPRLC